MTVTILDLERLPEDVALGHLLEMRGSIYHDTEAADRMGNNLCRNQLRVAEAFAAGLKYGRLLAGKESVR